MLYFSSLSFRILCQGNGAQNPVEKQRWKGRSPPFVLLKDGYHGGFYRARLSLNYGLPPMQWTWKYRAAVHCFSQLDMEDKETAANTKGQAVYTIMHAKLRANNSEKKVSRTTSVSHFLASLAWPNNKDKVSKLSLAAHQTNFNPLTSTYFSQGKSLVDCCAVNEHWENLV